jgi:hypothetical protein
MGMMQQWPKRWPVYALAVSTLFAWYAFAVLASAVLRLAGSKISFVSAGINKAKDAEMFAVVSIPSGLKEVALTSTTI